MKKSSLSLFLISLVAFSSSAIAQDVSSPTTTSEPEIVTTTTTTNTGVTTNSVGLATNPGAVLLTVDAANTYTVPAGTVITTRKSTYGDYYYFDVPYQNQVVGVDCYLIQPTAISGSLLGTFNIAVDGTGTPGSYYCYRHVMP